MKKTLVTLLSAGMLCISYLAMAEENGESTMPQAAQPSLSLQQRFDQCIGDAGCPMRQRLRLMEEMHDEMRVSIREMDRGCAATGEADCHMPGAQVEKWRDMHRRLGHMMKSMSPPGPETGDDEDSGNAGEEMEKKEPSSGTPDETGKKRPWRKWFD